MKSRIECDPLSEAAIKQYVVLCECSDENEIALALELLISKATLAIEKCQGRQVAEKILKRTTDNLARPSGARGPSASRTH